jgi:hypothetical protein
LSLLMLMVRPLVIRLILVGDGEHAPPHFDQREILPTTPCTR